MARKTVDNRKIVAEAKKKFGQYSERVLGAVSSGQMAVALRDLARANPELTDDVLGFTRRHGLSGQYEEAR